MRKELLGILGRALLMLILIIVVLLAGCIAMDRIVSIHSLSTQDAAGFSEDKFLTITTGMTPVQVRSVLGEPLRTSRFKDNREEWWYTAPKEPIEDWGTWDGRYLVICNGLVAQIFRHEIMNH